MFGGITPPKDPKSNYITPPTYPEIERLKQALEECEYDREFNMYEQFTSIYGVGLSATGPDDFKKQLLNLVARRKERMPKQNHIIDGLIEIKSVVGGTPNQSANSGTTLTEGSKNTESDTDSEESPVSTDGNEYTESDTDSEESPVSSQLTFPVIALSNFEAFEARTPGGVRRSGHVETFEKLQSYLRGYLGLDDDNTPINVLYVPTACFHHSKTSKTIYERVCHMDHTCGVAQSQMRGMFGEKTNVYMGHFYDPVLEGHDLKELTRDQIQTYYNEALALRLLLDTKGFQRQRLLCPSRLCNEGVNKNDIYDYGFEHLFELHGATRSCAINVNADDPEKPKEKLEQFIDANNIHVIYFVGGVTHWLQRQLKKIQFRKMLENLDKQRKKLVLSGNSAGAINLGVSTYLTAAKKTWSHWEHSDPIMDLSDEKGTINTSIVDEYPATQENPPIGVDYAGMAAAPFVFFPHYVYTWESYLLHKYVGDFNIVDQTENDLLRISETMIVLYVPPQLPSSSEPQLSYIFSNATLGAQIQEQISVYKAEGNHPEERPKELDKEIPGQANTKKRSRPNEDNEDAYMAFLLSLPVLDGVEYVEIQQAENKTSVGGKRDSVLPGVAIFGLALVTAVASFLGSK